MFLCTMLLSQSPFTSFLFFTYHPIFIDLRDDKQFFVDHPGAVPISTAQVRILTMQKLLLFITCSITIPCQSVDLQVVNLIGHTLMFYWIINI